MDQEISDFIATQYKKTTLQQWKTAAALSPVEQDDAWSEIEVELKQSASGGQFEGPCERSVAVGLN